MCGIYFQSNGVLPTEELDRALRMRGPDEFYFERIHQAVLAMYRLRIVGNEPYGRVFIEQGKYYLACNGEIFNYDELRKMLKIPRLQITSDTEIILKLYSQFGVSGFSMLEGMYAFILVDVNLNKVFFGRDPAGIKPLYIDYQTSGLTISSLPINDQRQIDGSVLAAGRFTGSAESLAICANEKSGLIPHGIVFQFCLSHKALLADSYSNNRITNFVPVGFKATIAAIEKAIRAQVPNDHRVGIFLSGGWDSALLASELASFCREKKFQLPICYTVDFSFNPTADAERAKKISELLGLEHVVVRVSINEMLNEVKKLSKLNMPVIFDSSLIITSILSKRVSDDGLKITFSGAGADEVFRGYARYKFPWLRYFKDCLFSFTQDGFLKFSVWYRLNIGGNLKSSSIRRLNLAKIDSKLNADFFGVDLSSDDLQFYLPENILALSDYATSIHGVECRVPFLDSAILGTRSQLDGLLAIFLPLKWVVKVSLRLRHPSVFKVVSSGEKAGFSAPIQRVVSSPAFRAELEYLIKKVGSDTKNFAWLQELPLGAGDSQLLWSVYITLVNKWNLNIQ